MYNEFGNHMKLVRLTKMCLNETYNTVGYKNLPGVLPVRNGLKQGNALSPLLFNFCFRVHH